VDIPTKATNTPGWREFDGPTFWMMATALAGYADYEVLATGALPTQLLLFAIILFCCWQAMQSYDELLSQSCDGPDAAAAKSRWAGLHMMAFGAAFLIGVGAAIILGEGPRSSVGQGRLLLFAGVLGCFMMRQGFRLYQ